MAVPVGVLVDGDKAVHAGFAPKMFPLVTAATAGGSVTPGGSYPYGTAVSVTAVPDGTHFFAGWSGDAAGTDPNLNLVITGPTAVTANFSAKLAQVISFPAPGDRPAGAPPWAPGATASSGLPVSYAVASGPAVVTGGQVQVTGSGTVVVVASQPGNAVYLPAAAVTQVFQGVAPAVVKLVAAGRVRLGNRATRSGEFLIQNP